MLKFNDTMIWTVWGHFVII